MLINNEYTQIYIPLIEPSRLKAFRSCNAHVHKSHVVKPSGVIVSSQNGGLGGGGTKPVENRENKTHKLQIINWHKNFH